MSNNIIPAFGSLYHPQKALLIYEQKTSSTDAKVYVESYDIAPDGYPINAHPLSVRESSALAKALLSNEGKTNFLQPKGLLPKNVLYFRTGDKAFAIWHTPKQSVNLLFSKVLGIDSGTAEIPALVWKATKTALAVYAVTGAELSVETALHHAPFFNIYKDGRVCMGNVQMTLAKDCALEDFVRIWQEAFFNSYFSHMLQGHNPVKGNLVQLWKSLIGTRKSFPAKSLIPLKATIKNLIP